MTPTKKKMLLKTSHPVRLKYFIQLVFFINLQSIQGTQNIHCPIGFIQAEEKNVGISCFQIKSHENFFAKYKRCSDNLVPLNFYEETNELAQTMGKETFWTDYVRAYEDGPFINWQLGNKHMGKPVVTKDNWDINNGSDMCATVSLTSKKFTAVKCNDTYSRFCYIKTYDNSDPIKWDCPEGYISFGSPVPACLITPSGESRTSRNSPLRATWIQASQFCNKSSGQLLHRGYIYTNHPEFTSEKFFNWELPLGIKKVGEQLMWVGHGGVMEDELIANAEWFFNPKENFSSQTTHVSLENQRWRLRENYHLYYYTICEYFVQLPVLNMQLVVDGKYDTMIILKTDQPNIPALDIFCFTDSVTYYPVRVNVSAIAESVYGSRFHLTTMGNGYYWCLTNNTKEYTWKEPDKLLFIYPNQDNNTCAVTVRFHNPNSIDTYVNIIEKEIEYYKRNIAGSLRTTSKRKYIFPHALYSDNQTNTRDPHGYMTEKIVLKRVYSNNSALVHVNGLELECQALMNIEMRYFNILSVRKLWMCDGFDTVPDTNVGVSVISVDNCYVFKCIGDFNNGARWEQISDFDNRPRRCSHHPNLTTTTTNPTETTTFTTQEIPTTTITTSDDKVSEVLNNLQTILNGTVEETQLVSAANQINEILSLPDDIVIPQSVLQTLDKIVEKLKLPKNTSHVKIVESNMAVVVTKTEGDEAIAGIKVGMISNGSLTEDSLQLLGKGDTSSNESSSEIIVRIPPNISNNRSRLSFTVFRNDRAFKQNITQKVSQVNTRILSITMSDEHKLPFPNGQFIDIYFRPYTAFGSQIDGVKACSYWNFDYGNWSTDGCRLFPAQNKNELDICRCYHLTHFAEIITSNDGKFSDSNEYILMIISYAGCVLSLIGLAIIGLTGFVFKSWRRDFSNKIWLHLSAAVSIMIITFLIISIVDFKNNDIEICVAAGVLLHYSVLASFCWMLISAVLSYKRLVTVFTKSTSHRLLKACAFGWIMPIIPIGALFAVDPDNYSKNFRVGYLQKEFCYPSNLGFWLTVFLPVALIVGANTILFLTIIYSVFISSRIKRHGDTQQIYRSITVSFLLFFLFGISWLFGLFSDHIVMAYLFCTTATMQGLVLFLFFVLGNKKTRDMWCIYFRCKESRKIPVTSTMSRSIQSRVQNGASIHRKFEDGMATKPRSLSGNIDNSRFS